MYDRFRDLEKAEGGRRLDVVLMATVSSFEVLKRPTRHEMKQFAELFLPLFHQVTTETRRTAVAALSRCTVVPRPVIRSIVDQPIEICAPFLANSSTLDDEDIGEIAATNPVSHARALARRRRLSPAAVAALVQTRDSTVLRSLRVRGLLPDEPAAAPEDVADVAKDETLRQRLRELVGQRQRQVSDRPDSGAVPMVSRQDARRLHGFAADGEALFFATALADVLGCGFRLAEQIMLDISGKRLAATLTAVGLELASIETILQAFFPHLAATGERASPARRLAERIEWDAAAGELARLLAGEPRGQTAQMPAVAQGHPRTDNARKSDGADASEASQIGDVRRLRRA